MQSLHHLYRKLWHMFLVFTSPLLTTCYPRSLRFLKFLCWHTHRFKTTRRESRLREGVCRQGFCYVRARQPLRGTGGWGTEREANSLKRKQETLHIWTGSKDNRKSGMSNLTVLFSESQCIKNWLTGSNAWIIRNNGIISGSSLFSEMI